MRRPVHVDNQAMGNLPAMRYEYERRKYKANNWISRAGRSTVDIECPFCGKVTQAYIWSLAGSGKRCSGQDCDAVHEWLNQTTRRKATGLEAGG